MYNDHVRELRPVILGHSKGEVKALTFQFGGGSTTKLSRGGEWRRLFLSKVSDVELRDGPLIVGSGHAWPRGCVEVVDLDVNPSSPYQPRRRAR